MLTLFVSVLPMQVMESWFADLLMWALRVTSRIVLSELQTSSEEMGKKLMEMGSAEPVWVSVGDHDVTSLEAVSDHEKALLRSRKNGREIKALLLCNPHNPLGRCYSKEVLEAYLTLCGKHGIHFIR